MREIAEQESEKKENWFGLWKPVYVWGIWEFEKSGEGFRLLRAPWNRSMFSRKSIASCLGTEKVRESVRKCYYKNKNSQCVRERESVFKSEWKRAREKERAFIGERYLRDGGGGFFYRLGSVPERESIWIGAMGLVAWLGLALKSDDRYINTICFCFG